MPPPVSGPDCQDYLGSEHLAPDPTLATLLQTWLDAGAPEGGPPSGGEGDRSRGEGRQGFPGRRRRGEEGLVRR